MPGGRPSKLDDPTTRERILREVSFGVPIEHAAAAAGVAASTLHDWRQRGRGTHKRRGPAPKYVEFVEALREAQGRAVSTVQLAHMRLALGQQVKHRTTKTTLTDEGAHEQVVTEEFFPASAPALQWWMERRVREYVPTVAQHPEHDDEEALTADADPTATRDKLDSLLDRYVTAAATDGGPGPSEPPAGGAGG